MPKKINFDINSGIPDDFVIRPPTQNPKKKRQHKSYSKKDVKSFFAANHNYEHDATFKHTWKALKADKLLNGLGPLTAGKLRDIDKLFKSNVVYTGKGMEPAPLYEKNEAINDVVQALLHGIPLTKKVIGPDLLKAIFIQKEEAFLEHFRSALEAEMVHLQNNIPQNDKEELIWRAFLGNIIALLPFTYPKSGTSILIPQLAPDRSSFKIVEYQIDVLKLSHLTYTSDMTALTMTPKNSNDSPPMISFIGTTYPAGEGFLSTILADFTPGHSVGEAVYKQNKPKIENWLKDKKDVQAYGMSLGGAMALHAYRNHPDKFARMDLYSPPGLYKKMWKDRLETQCQINIYTQPGDVVTELGQWPVTDNVKLYSIITDSKKPKKNPLVAHAMVNTGCKKITVLKLNPLEENKSLFRSFITWAHKFIAPVAVWAPLRIFLIGKYLTSKLSPNKIDKAL